MSDTTPRLVNRGEATVSTADMTPRDLPEYELAGRQLGDFLLGERLGEGGFGALYRAQQRGLAREVAVKVLLRDPRSTVERERFLREAKLASLLDHPYAAHVYASGAEPDGVLWIAMELVRGTPLNALLKREGPLPLSRFTPLLEKLCEVVHSAHQQGIIHRDIKPANVMVISRAGQLFPKLLDLGIAKATLVPETQGELAPKAPADLTEPTPRVEQLAPSGVTSELTGAGRVVGSPKFIAPELWADPSLAGVASDLYAMGVLAFIAVTGKPPYDAEAVLQLMAAHQRDPIPSLGPGFPQELQEVMQRALAKKPHDRQASLLVFAAEFRRAAHSDESAPVGLATLPSIDPALRDELVGRGPQVLAGCLAALAIAKTPARAWDLVGRTAQAAVQLPALVALAHRFESDEVKLSEAGARLLRDLRQRELSLLDWLELGESLVEGPAEPSRPLRQALADSLGRGPGSLREPVEALAGQLAEVAHLGHTPSDGELMERLGRSVPLLSAVLRKVRFLVDYRLVVPRSSGLELWAGQAREIRELLTPPASPLPAGQPMLLDGDGKVTVGLWPLVQVLAPAPGQPEELFLLSGPGRFGALLVSPPVGYERSDTTVWEWFDERLLSADHDLVGAHDTGAPYLGLSTFSAKDARLFFGRERTVEDFLNRLQRRPFHAVVGPSGTGKSSFVQAGVLPCLRGPYLSVVVRPGPRPLAALRAKLESAGLGRAPAEDEWERDPRSLGRWLRAGRDTDQSVVIVVDQFEEVLTLCHDTAEREQYVRLLVLATEAGDGRVRVILTLRDDFLIRAEQLPLLREQFAQGLQLLGTPNREDLLRILTGPAKLRGYAFETPDLPEEMVDAVQDQAGALALLSFTASKLWEQRDARQRHLTRAAYQALGGVGGALGQHAEATLNALPPEGRARVREAFRHLVTSEGTRTVLTRTEFGQLVGRDGAADSLLEHLIAARLLVASEGAGGEERIEIIHEALIASWPRLAGWRHEDRENARLRDQLRAAARQWEERKRSKGLLWRGDALTEYRLWKKRYPGAVTEVEEAFGRASIAEEQRSKRTRRVALSGFVAMLVVGLAVVLNLYRRSVVATADAEESQRQTQRTLGYQYFDQGRQAVLRGDPMRGLAYLHEASRLGNRGPAVQFLIEQARRVVDAELHVLGPHAGRVNGVAYSSDGRLVATANDDRAVRIWSAESGALLQTLVGHAKSVSRVAFSPDGKTVASACYDGTVRLWELATGKMVRELKTGNDCAVVLAFLHDGQTLLTGGFDEDVTNDHGRLTLWSVSTGKEVRALGPLTGGVWEAQLVRGEAALAVGTRDGQLSVFNTETGARLYSVAAHPAGAGLSPVSVSAPAPADPRARFATAAFETDATVKIWEGATGRLLFSVNEGTEPVECLAASPQRAEVAAGTMDGWLLVIDLESGKVRHRLKADGAAVMALRYSPDGKALASGHRDGAVRLWESRTGKLLWTFSGHLDVVMELVFSPNGRELVSAGGDRIAIQWRADLERRLRSLVAHQGQALSVDVSPDGKAWVTAGQDKTIAFWEASTGKLLGRHPQAEEPSSVRFSSSGRYIVGRVGKEALLWDSTLNELSRFSQHTGEVTSVEINRDETLLATASLDRTARLFSLQTRQPLALFRATEEGLSHTDFAPDSKTMVSASPHMEAYEWLPQTGEKVRTLVGHTRPVHSARFSHDGRSIVTAAGDTFANIWDPATAKVLRVLQGHTGEVITARFSADDALVVTTSADGTARVWDAASGANLVIFDHGQVVLDAVFGPDGAELVTADLGGAVTSWPVGRSRWTHEEFSAYLAARVPFRVQSGSLVRVETEGRSLAATSALEPFRQAR